MPRKKQAKLREEDLHGFEYFQILGPLLELLHEVGTQRDRAGNRQLHFDQYCALPLLYFFDPALSSLRGIQPAGQLQKVQKKLGCRRTSLGSLSEAASVFDAQQLEEIIVELADSVPRQAEDPRCVGNTDTLCMCHVALDTLRLPRSPRPRLPVFSPLTSQTPLPLYAYLQSPSPRLLPPTLPSRNNRAEQY